MIFYFIILLLHFVSEEKLVANKLLYNNLYSCVVVKVNHCTMLVYKFKWAMLTSVPFFSASLAAGTRDAKKHVFFKPCFLCKKKSVFY